MRERQRKRKRDRHSKREREREREIMRSKKSRMWIERMWSR